MAIVNEDNIGKVEQVISRIEERITRPVPDLVINRLPKKTKDEFLRFAEEEYCSDWGMAFKAVFDFYKGVALSGNEKTEAILSLHEDRITALESLYKAQESPKQPQEKVIMSVGGNIIGGKKE